MDLRNIFTSYKTLDADEVRGYMNGRDPGDFQLVDVRQEEEYRQGHLPGARLMPLPQLTERYGELDPETPVIVY